MTRLTTPKSTYTIDYPQSIEFAERQNSVFWLPTEIKVEKDVQDILVNMTPTEKHGVLTVLKLFTLYELKVGTDYWGNVVMKKYPRPDIQRMATTFSFFELAVHAPFYNKINEALNLATDEFYSSYIEDEVLKSRMDFLDDALNDRSYDGLFSLGVFSLVEGAILYTNFAYLKHFQALGKNKIPAICSGINFSVRDENIHHEGGAWLFRTHLSEKIADGSIPKEQVDDLYQKIIEATNILREHEHQISKKIFEMGEISGITCEDLCSFLDSRLDLCLSNIGIEAQFKPEVNPVADWFYKGINAYVQHDFFVKQGNQYNRNWSEDEFEWSNAA